MSESPVSDAQASTSTAPMVQIDRKMTMQEVELNSKIVIDIIASGQCLSELTNYTYTHVGTNDPEAVAMQYMSANELAQYNRVKTEGVPFTISKETDKVATTDGAKQFPRMALALDRLFQTTGYTRENVAFLYQNYPQHIPLVKAYFKVINAERDAISNADVTLDLFQEYQTCRKLLGNAQYVFQNSSPEDRAQSTMIRKMQTVMERRMAELAGSKLRANKRTNATSASKDFDQRSQSTADSMPSPVSIDGSSKQNSPECSSLDRKSSGRRCAASRPEPLHLSKGNTSMNTSGSKGLPRSPTSAVQQEQLQPPQLHLHQHQHQHQHQLQPQLQNPHPHPHQNPQLELPQQHQNQSQNLHQPQQHMHQQSLPLQHQHALQIQIQNQNKQQRQIQHQQLPQSPPQPPQQLPRQQKNLRPPLQPLKQPPLPPTLSASNQPNALQNQTADGRNFCCCNHSFDCGTPTYEGASYDGASSNAHITSAGVGSRPNSACPMGYVPVQPWFPISPTPNPQPQSQPQPQQQSPLQYFAGSGDAHFYQAAPSLSTNTDAIMAVTPVVPRMTTLNNARQSRFFPQY